MQFGFYPGLYQEFDTFCHSIYPLGQHNVSLQISLISFIKILFSDIQVYLKFSTQVFVKTLHDKIKLRELNFNLDFWIFKLHCVGSLLFIFYHFSVLGFF